MLSTTDRDALTFLVDHRPVKVRLAEIDTSEVRQPWDTNARQALAAIAVRKDTRVVVLDVDRYDRTVGWVDLGLVDVNAVMVVATKHGLSVVIGPVAKAAKQALRTKATACCWRWAFATSTTSA